MTLLLLLAITTLVGSKLELIMALKFSLISITSSLVIEIFKVALISPAWKVTLYGPEP